MPLLLAEVMDKVEEGFVAAISIAGLTALTGLIFGRWAPRPVPAVALAGSIAFGALLVAFDHDDIIYDYAYAEAGPRGVALYASHHVLWLGPVIGLLVGLALRPRRDEQIAAC